MVAHCVEILGARSVAKRSNSPAGQAQLAPVRWNEMLGLKCIIALKPSNERFKIFGYESQVKRGQIRC